ncbi:MAG: NUDIX hydrolase [Cypionkella sp.]|nr:NUDIX hydrolase [Cypionkella sp.]
MIKRYGGAVLPGKVYRRRPGVYSILMRDGAILITHQFEPKPEFQLPGGGIDPGESPSAALHREVMEETGWHIANLRRLGVFRRFTHMPEYGFWAEKICTVYTARPVLKIAEPTEAGHFAVWMEPRAALRLLGNEGDRAMLARALKVQPVPR